MKQPPRPAPAVERRSLPAKRPAGQRDADELEAICRALRHIPRENLASMPDVIHWVHRCAGRLPAIIERLRRAPLPRPPAPRVRLAGRPAADHAAIVAGVFGKGRAPRPTRERTRTVAGRKGRAVKVVERTSAQLELTV